MLPEKAPQDLTVGELKQVAEESASSYVVLNNYEDEHPKETVVYAQGAAARRLATFIENGGLE